MRLLLLGLLATIVLAVVLMLRSSDLGLPAVEAPDAPASGSTRGVALLVAAEEAGVARGGVDSPAVSGTAESHAPAQAEDEAPEVFEEIEEWDDSQDAELLEQLGLSTDAPGALRLGRGGPPDPLERGDASLVLTLVDREQGKPLESEVVLWRIDAPANAYWTAGDQDVARARVGREGHVFADLAVGEYRVVVVEERAHAPHQPAFFVSGRTPIVLSIEPPALRPVRLALAGAQPPLPRVEADFFQRTMHPRPSVPPWVNWREMQPGLETVVDFETWEGDPEFARLSEWLILRETPSGYDLGTFSEDTRERAYRQKVSLRCDDGWTAGIEVSNTAPGDIITVKFDPAASAGSEK